MHLGVCGSSACVGTLLLLIHASSVPAAALPVMDPSDTPSALALADGGEGACVT